MSGPRIQFGMSFLIAMTLVISVVAAALWAVPKLLGIVILIFVSLAAAALMTVEVVWGPGRYGRGFCIGALFPIGLLLLTIAMTFGFVPLIAGAPPSQRMIDTYFRPFRWMCCTAWAMSAACGSLCCLRLWMIERRASK